MTIDVILEDPRWTDLPPLAERASAVVLAHMGLDPETCEISVLGCDDARIAVLNAEFRDKPKATNVLSWPAEDLSSEDEGTEPYPPEPDFDGSTALGDIAISYDTCTREAVAAGKPVADHVTHLVVHGLLHLLGYDHERDGDAALMESLEVEILGKLGIDDPYRV
ncbi:rRNA maturation RNase YbeY [Lutimaribacter marinistellae]|uniref:Endoribonuclease YbeY n=1 Tax=Lutimaribacter marinistellae TaxID=1820329 RepID=A0ABV7TGL5_9RHOB